MSYTKLDSSITDSTIWQASDTTRIVWITMLAMADQNGYIGGSVPGLAGRARVSLDACVKALECLTEPDIWSRTKEHEGRRIAEADGGWVLLNHAKYRATQNADDRRERSRVAMADLRASRKQLTPVRKQLASVNGKVNELTKLTQAEAEAETEAKAGSTELKKEHGGKPFSSAAPTDGLAKYPPGFEDFYAQFPKKVGKDAAARAFGRRKFKLEDRDRLLEAIARQREWPTWKKNGGEFIPHPATWLNEGRWDDEAPKHLTNRADQLVADNNAAGAAWLSKHQSQDDPI